MENQLTNSVTENTSTVDVIIPVYRADDKLDSLIRMLYRQTIKPSKVIILHTEEYPGEELPIPLISESNIIVVPIAKSSFDHGGTRKYGASLSDADIMVFMTQDAIPLNEHMLANLIKPYADPKVAATYARQVADINASMLERLTRYYNYPKKSQIKSKEDIDSLGIKAFFCSNVCASYRNKVYRELGGFVDKTIFNEDMILAYEIIDRGYKIAYTASAKVEHSHNYSYLQQLSRNFDLGVSHNQYIEIFGSVKSTSEGVRLVNMCLRYLIAKREYLMIPDLILTSAMKYLGYQLGKHYDILPKPLVVSLSMNKSYWK
ncbi:MAG: glycosyltransferase family 2 protein [Clostridiales bacterium]|nr:glycosyltransferase family 2 protein [Clostridiales bacterium]